MLIIKKEKIFSFIKHSLESFIMKMYHFIPNYAICVQQNKYSLKQPITKPLICNIFKEKHRLRSTYFFYQQFPLRFI